MEKKNNILVIILIIIIVLILVIGGYLFISGKVVFNSEVNSNDTINESSTNNDSYVLSESEATAIIKDLYTNDLVQEALEEGQFTYCNVHDDDSSKTYESEELGIDRELSNEWYKCNDVKTYEEVENVFLKYFTSTCLNKDIKPNSTFLFDEEFYTEKDGNLYSMDSGKGGDLSRSNIKNINSTLSNITSTKIDAKLNVSWYMDDSSIITAEDNITISIIKENDTWKINEYNLNNN